ncbi:hypothetical protein [Prosthecomicrobium pneumaticum]|uniref:Uncharacterized protein n=1 Tax=Prosthecomicrobium pneumaticum TaxID=81895 RepID=A0A7W9FP89_9HYPH|nr:hypothetical protein [Prosthecomicrobium pneumaticum]MBB5754347.1 hypothetical protein [Prosthecomicrobium pneumaticum]
MMASDLIHACDRLAQATDFLGALHMAIETLDERVQSPLLTVLGEAQRRIGDAHNALDEMHQAAMGRAPA